MDTPGYFLASAVPLLLLAAGHWCFRGLRGRWRLTLDLALLVLSFPFGIALIGWILHFPTNPGDHSPGIGVAFVYLMAMWAIAALIWLILLGVALGKRFLNQRSAAHAVWIRSQASRNSTSDVA
jgi:hypothetical protein